VLFALGLLAKPMLVTLPFVLLLLDYWPLRRFEHTSVAAERAKQRTLVWLDKLPLLALAVASSALTLAAQSRGGIVQSLEQVPLAMRLANAVVSFVRYAVNLLVPLRQAFYYPYPRTLPTLEAASALVLLGAVTYACMRLRRERPYALVGWLWYVGMLVPVIGLVQVATQAMADRYTYLPSIGLFIAITWAVADWIRSRPAWRAALAVAAVLGLCALGIKSHAQAAYWKDDLTLFARDTVVVKDNALAYRNLGVALGAAGRYAEALSMFQRALPYYPNDALTLYDLGGALDKLGRDEEAAASYRASIRNDPGLADAHFHLADVLGRLGRGDEAITELREAIRLRADYISAYDKLGSMLSRRGDYAGAIASYRQALRIDPLHVESHNNLGTALHRDGRDSAAREEFETALRINPLFAPAEMNLAMVYMLQGDTAQVRRHLARGMQLDPELGKRVARDIEQRLRAAAERGTKSPSD
jgi:Flp pilus assembly protein TadD